MDISDIFRDAVYYPIDHYKNWFIIGVLYLIYIGLSSFMNFAGKSVVAISSLIALLIPIIISGIGISIMNNTLKEKEDFPSLSPVNNLIDGIKMSILIFIYELLPVIITSIIAIPLGVYSSLSNIITTIPDDMPFWLGIQSIPPEALTSFILSFGYAMILMSILFIISGLFLVMGQARLAETGNILESLNLKYLFKKIHSIGWKKYITCIIILIVAAIVIAVLELMFAISIPTYGILFSMFVLSSFSSIFTYRSIALIYMEG